MTTPKTGRLQKAAALVPLAVLSTAWTVTLAGAGVTASVVSADPDPAEPAPRGRHRARGGHRGPGERVLG